MNDYKVGDITPDGFEIFEVEYVPHYKMRKRIMITNFEGSTEKIKNGNMGYYVINDQYGQYGTVFLDNGIHARLSKDIFIFIDDENKTKL